MQNLIQKFLHIFLHNKRRIAFAVISLVLVAATVLSFNILSPNKAEAADVATVVFHDFATVTTATSSKTSDTVSLNLNSSSISLWGTTIRPQEQITKEKSDIETIEFVGWTTSKTATNLPSANILNQTVTAASPLHLYAVYEYTIRCNFYRDCAFSGEEKVYVDLMKQVVSDPIRVNSSVADVGNPWDVLLDMVDFNYGSPLPYRLGYTLSSWQAGDVIFTPSETIIADSNFDVYANWAECDTYTLQYDANGGSGAPSSQEENVGLAVTVSSTTPTRTGYTFAGWNTKADGTGTDYAAGSSYTSSTKGTYTIYAKWTPISYSISYILDGGSVSPANKTSYTPETATFTLNNPTKTGYTFTGWTGTGLSEQTTTVTIPKGSTGNRSYTAHWSINTYTITYNANGGTGAPGNQTKNYNVSINLSSTVPSRTHYVFKGWSESSTAETATYSSGALYSENRNLSLYAVWEYSPSLYHVVYNANSSGDSVSGLPSEQTKTEGTPLLLSSQEPSRTGYNFSGWNTRSDGLGTSYSGGTLYEQDANLTLYAQWTPIVYTVTYNTNGGENAPDNQTKSYNVNLTLSSDIPVKEGFAFTCWNTSVDGTGTTYLPGTVYTTNASLTLFAQYYEETTDTIIINQDFEDDDANTAKVYDIYRINYDKNTGRSVFNDYETAESPVSYVNSVVVKGNDSIEINGIKNEYNSSVYYDKEQLDYSYIIIDRASTTAAVNRNFGELYNSEASVDTGFGSASAYQNPLIFYENYRTSHSVYARTLLKINNNMSQYLSDFCHDYADDINTQTLCEDITALTSSAADTLEFYGAICCNVRALSDIYCSSDFNNIFNNSGAIIANCNNSHVLSVTFTNTKDETKSKFIQDTVKNKVTDNSITKS